MNFQETNKNFCAHWRAIYLEDLNCQELFHNSRKNRCQTVQAYDMLYPQNRSKDMAVEPNGRHVARTRLRKFLRSNGALEAFETLVSLLPQAAVFVVDSERTILLWSPGAEKLLGYTPEVALGQNCLTSNRCPSCIRGCGISEYGSVSDVPLVLYRPNGQPVRVRKTARAFFDEDGSFAGGIEVLMPDDTSEDALTTSPTNVVNFHQMVSRSHRMLQAFDIVQNVGTTDVTVLIRGESGTGKELFARALHAESERKNQPFVAVNCAAFAPSLLESELFGHVRGAFTGATRDRPGLFSRANGGTLFLDEVAELPLELQAKLLRVLQEQSFTPVGGTRSLSVDVRIVSATHRALRAMAKEGRFREDLLYRLRVVPIYLPSLRERREDIEVLLWHFIERRGKEGEQRIKSVDPEAMRALLTYSWPGNVRELQNVVDYAFAVGRGKTLNLLDLPPEIQDQQTREALMGTPRMPPSMATSWNLDLDGQTVPSPGYTGAPWNSWQTPPPLPSSEPPMFAGASGWAAPASPIPHGDEQTRIQTALQYANGHLGKAAALLGMSRTTLWRKRKKYGI